LVKQKNFAKILALSAAAILFGTVIGAIQFSDVKAQVTFAPDHYLSYRIADKLGPDFEPVQVRLIDQFEAGLFDVKKPLWLYNPAQKNDESTHDLVTHLMGYKIRGEHEERLIQVQNQFENFIAETGKADRLLVPTAKSHDGPVGELESTLVDHFKCYKIDVLSSTTNDVKKRVSVFDTNFQELRDFRVGPAKWICNPVTKIHEEVTTNIQHPDDHLTCYKVKPKKGDLGHAGPVFVDTNNQFGPEFLKTLKHDHENKNGKVKKHELCVPSLKSIIEE